MMIEKLRVAVVGVSCVVLSVVGCGSGGGGTSQSPAGGFSGGTGSVERLVLDSFVNDVILDTYGRLDAETAGLLAAVDAFIAAPNDTTLQAARAAWIRTRVPWEESETTLFGPVDFNGFDPALDTWPVNRVDLDGVLMSSTSLTTATVANFDPSVKGFHTIEYLLFGNGGDRVVSDFDARSFAYLRATTEDLKNVASLLLRSWSEGINGSAPYAQEFVSAGQGSAIYPTEQAAIEEIVRGMITISDEVANGKIADPFDTRDTELVESQFSYNSITDFSSDMRGVQNVYTRSLGMYVASVDPGLDARVNGQLVTVLNALAGIPEPFRAAILDPANDAVIRNAQEQIRMLQRILELEVLPLVIS